MDKGLILESEYQEIISFYGHEMNKVQLVDGIELNKVEDIKRFNLDYPLYQDLPCFINSDAHRLSDIKNCAYPISPSKYESFWS